jgi:uncharacterized protein (TIGR02466 family)
MSAELSLKDHMMLAFATPVVVYPWPDSDALNEQLRELILGAERKDAGITRSNVGGWHSGFDFFERDEPCVRLLEERIIEMSSAVLRETTLSRSGVARTFDCRIDGWANVSRHGHYNAVHNHPNTMWSGTYYVSAGRPDPDTPTNGRFELLDPRTGANMVRMEDTLMQPRYLIAPEPGLMVIFPSYVNHFVHPFFGAGERISIAFIIHASEAAQTAA